MNVFPFKRQKSLQYSILETISPEAEPFKLAFLACKMQVWNSE